MIDNTMWTNVPFFPNCDHARHFLLGAQVLLSTGTKHRPVQLTVPLSNASGHSYHVNHVLLCMHFWHLQVRGVLNKEEVVMAKETQYLSRTHLVVATPSALVEVYSGEDRK